MPKIIEYKRSPCLLLFVYKCNNNDWIANLVLYKNKICLIWENGSFDYNESLVEEFEDLVNEGEYIKAYDYRISQ